jgi:UPF0271 protein
MPIVLDSSAILNAHALHFDFECYTVPEVIAEARDIRSRSSIQYAADSGLLKVRAPLLNTLLETIEKAKKTGDFEKLSGTDLKILALAKQLNAEIWTDDYAIQNVAHFLHLKYKPVAMKPMKRPIAWRKKCPNCGKIYDVSETRCEVCDEKLVRAR